MYEYSVTCVHASDQCSNRKGKKKNTVESILSAGSPLHSAVELFGLQVAVLPFLGSRGGGGLHPAPPHAPYRNH